MIVAHFRNPATAESLEFEPLGTDTVRHRKFASAAFRSAQFQPPAEMVQRTYLGTHDSPQLDGVRPIDEILEGYREVGRFNSAHWLLRRDGRDIVCLICRTRREGHWFTWGCFPVLARAALGVGRGAHAQWLPRRRCWTHGPGHRRPERPAMAMYAAADSKPGTASALAEYYLGERKKKIRRKEKNPGKEILEGFPNTRKRRS